MVSTMPHNMVVGMGNSARSLVLLQEWIMDSSEEGRRMRDNPLTLSFTHTVEHCLWQAQSLNKHNNKWCGKWNIFFSEIEMQNIVLLGKYEKIRSLDKSGQETPQTTKHNLKLLYHCGLLRCSVWVNKQQG